MALKTYHIAIVEDQVYAKLDSMGEIALCIKNTLFRDRFFPSVSQSTFNKIVANWKRDRFGSEQEMSA